MKDLIKMIKDKFNSMEQSVKKIMKNGLMFSFIVIVISTIILLTYNFLGYLYLYYIGLGLFQAALFWAIEFIICAVAIDTIKKQIC